MNFKFKFFKLSLILCVTTLITASANADTTGWIWQYLTLTNPGSTAIASANWYLVDRDAGTVGIETDTRFLYKVRNDGSIWRTLKDNIRWEKLDNNWNTVGIATNHKGNGKLYQMHRNGLIWEFTGTPCNVASAACPGWQIVAHRENPPEDPCTNPLGCGVIGLDPYAPAFDFTVTNLFGSTINKAGQRRDAFYDVVYKLAKGKSGYFIEEFARNTFPERWKTILPERADIASIRAFDMGVSVLFKNGTIMNYYSQTLNWKLASSDSTNVALGDGFHPSRIVANGNVFTAQNSNIPNVWTNHTMRNDYAKTVKFVQNYTSYVYMKDNGVLIGTYDRYNKPAYILDSNPMTRDVISASGKYGNATLVAYQIHGPRRIFPTTQNWICSVCVR